MKVIITEETSKDIIDRLLKIGGITNRYSYDGNEMSWGGDKKYHYVNVIFDMGSWMRRIRFAFVDRGNGIEEGMNTSWPAPRDLPVFQLVPDKLVQDYYMEEARKFLMDKLGNK